MKLSYTHKFNHVHFNRVKHSKNLKTCLVLCKKTLQALTKLKVLYEFIGRNTGMLLQPSIIITSAAGRKKHESYHVTCSNAHGDSRSSEEAFFKA